MHACVGTINVTSSGLLTVYEVGCSDGCMVRTALSVVYPAAVSALNSKGNARPSGSTTRLDLACTMVPGMCLSTV